MASAEALRWDWPALAAAAELGQGGGGPAGPVVTGRTWLFPCVIGATREL